MNYDIVKIEDICSRVTSGGTPKTSNPNFYSPEEIPWLKTGEVNYCRIYDTENYISKEGLERSSAKLIPANSVIVAMYGQGDTAGRVAINKIPLSTNQACCNLIINHYIADYEYVYYALSIMYDKFVSLKNGGAQPNLNAGIVKSIEIPFPDLKTQQRIASVLSAYDSLIENNQKQINLLEEAAQRLYKEWFVDLRFPGYEGVEVVDGVPEGWEKDTFANVASLKAGGDKPTNFSKNRNGKFSVPVYSNGTENEGLYGYTDIPVIEEACVTISARGSVGYACLRREPFVPIVRLTSVVPNEIDVIYLYLYLKNFKFDSNGAAQQQITVPMIKDKEILLPSKKVINKFIKQVYPIRDEIDNLKKQIEKITEARDRLLPKLMSGELEV